MILFCWWIRFPCFGDNRVSISVLRGLHSANKAILVVLIDKAPSDNYSEVKWPKRENPFNQSPIILKTPKT